VSVVLCPDEIEEALVKKTEWMREDLASSLTPEHLQQKEAAGWKPVAIEWKREIDVMPEPGHPGGSAEEIPFGMQIASDCRHLEENTSEMQVLKLLAEMIVQDLSFPQMAETLNQRGFRTRDGRLWSPLAVFKLTPRLVDVAPRIWSGSEWETRKKEMRRVAWNS
jgi:hypothetical protein